MSLLDLIFPKTCVGCSRFGSYICEACLNKVEYFQTQVCPECYRNSINGQIHKYCWKKNSLDGVISFVNYKSPVREIVQQLKYRFTTDLLKEFSGKFKFEKDLIKGKNWTVLPLPLHRERQNFRGFNQAELLGKIVSEKLNLNFNTTVLKKMVKTKPQVGLSKKERKANINDVFKVEKSLTEENYFLFDDVWTSGASLKSAAGELKEAGAKNVWGITLAHPR